MNNVVVCAPVVAGCAYFFTINDLFSVCEPWGEEYYIDYCHLTQKGYSILAERVAEFIKPYI